MKKVINIRRFVVVTLLVWGVVFMTQGIALSKEKPYEGITLRMMGPRWTQVEFFEESAKKIAEEMGMKIEVTYVGYDDSVAKLLLDAKAKVSTWDIVIFTGMQFATLVEGGVLYPFDEFIFNYDIADPYKVMFEDFLPSSIVAGTYEGELYALESTNSCVVLAYRTDLFNSPTEKKNFKAKYGYDLQAPETYAQFYDIAEFFTRKAGEKLDGKVLKEDFYGTVHSNKRGSYVFHDYISYMVAFGADILYDPKTIVPTFDSPENIEAIKFYVSLTPFLPPDHINMTSGEASMMFTSGKVAMALEFSDTVQINVLDSDESKVADKTALALPPSRKGITGREHATIQPLDGYSLYRYSKNKEAAYKLLEEYFSPPYQKLATLKGAPASRYSVLRDPEVRAKASAARLTEKAEGEAYIFGHPRLPEYAKAKDIAATGIHQILIAEKTVEEAVADVQKQLVSLFRKAGYIK